MAASLIKSAIQNQILQPRNLFCTSAVCANYVNNNNTKPFASIPCPKKLPVFGHLHLFSRMGPYSFEKLYDAHEDLHQKYGPIVRLDLGIRMILLFDPEDVRKIFQDEQMMPRRPLFEALRYYRLKQKKFRSAGLFTENGPEWKKLRSAANFMMKPKFAHTYLPQQEEIADEFIKRIRKLRKSNGRVENFLQELYRFSTEAIGLVCFGRKLGLFEEKTGENDRSVQLTKAVGDGLKAMADTLLGIPWWKIYETPTYKMLVESQTTFINFASDCVKEAKYKISQDVHRTEPTLELLRIFTENERLSSDDVALMLVEMFSAGIDTTGNAIGFALYNFTKRLDVQDRLFDEIQKHVPCGSTIAPDVLNQLLFLRASIKESHRLNPVTGGSARILTSSTVLSGYEVPANTLCLGSNPTISRQSKYFQDPLSYRPERWLETSEGKKPHPYCVMPFGHGVRRCVGQRFAEQEMKLLLLKIVQNFRLEYDGPEIGTKMRLILAPDKELDFRFIDR